MITVLTRGGPGKSQSQDTVLVGRLILSDEISSFPILKQGFLCVADSVGGHPGGAEASRFVTEALATVETILEDETVLKEILLSVNQQLISAAKIGQTAGMATTLTGTLLSKEKNYLFHSGNTRAFILQGAYLKQLTDDHTLRERLRQLGQYEESVRCNPSELIGCFGGGDSRLAAALTVVPMQEFRTLLFTSDGIHDYLDIEQMEEILASELTDDKKCLALEKRARQNGSADDISIVILRNE